MAERNPEKLKFLLQYAFGEDAVKGNDPSAWENVVTHVAQNPVITPDLLEGVGDYRAVTRLKNRSNTEIGNYFSEKGIDPNSEGAKAILESGYLILSKDAVEQFLRDRGLDILSVSKDRATSMGLNATEDKESFTLRELQGMADRHGYINLSTISDPLIKEQIVALYTPNHNNAIDSMVSKFSDVTREQVEGLIDTDILFTSEQAVRRLVLDKLPFRREVTDDAGNKTVSRANFEEIERDKLSEYSFSVEGDAEEREMKLDEIRDNGFRAEERDFIIEDGRASQLLISAEIFASFGFPSSEDMTPHDLAMNLAGNLKTITPIEITSSSIPEEAKKIVLGELYAISLENFEKAANEPEYGDFTNAMHPNDLLFLQYDKYAIRKYILENYPFRNNELNDTLKPFSRKNSLTFSDPSKTSYTRIVDGEEVEVAISSIDKENHMITLENGESFYFYGFEGDGPNIEGAIAPTTYNGQLTQEQLDKLKSMIGKGDPAITVLPISVSMDSGVKDRAGNIVNEQVYRHVGLSFEIDNATTLEEINQTIEDKIKELQDKYNEEHPEVTPPAPGGDPGDPGNPTGGGTPPPAGGRPPLRGTNMGVAGKQYKMKFVDIKFAYLRSLLDLAERDEGFVLPQDVQDKIDALYSLDEAVTPTTLMDTIKKLQNSMLRSWKEGSDRGDLRKQLIMMNKHHNEELIELSREAYANPEPEQPAATPKRDLIVVFDEIQTQDKNDRDVRIALLKSKRTKEEVRQETDKMYTALVGDPIDMVSLSEKMNIIMNYQKWINQLEKLKSAALIAREKAELFTSGTAFPGEDPVKEYQKVNAEYINAFLKFKAFCETKTPAGVDYRTIANAGIGLIQAIRVGDEISGNTETRPLFAVSEPVPGESDDDRRARLQSEREDMNAYHRYIQLYNKLNKVRSELRSLRQKRSTTVNKLDRKAIDDRIEQLEIQCITYEKAVTNMVKKDVDGNRATLENPSQVRSYEEGLLTNSLLGRLGVLSTEAGKTAIRYDIDGTEAFIAPKTVSALGSKIHLMRPGKGRTPEGLGISPLVNLDNFFVMQRVINGHDITPEQLQEMSAALEEAPTRPERDSDDGRDEM